MSRARFIGHSGDLRVGQFVYGFTCTYGDGKWHARALDETLDATDRKDAKRKVVLRVLERLRVDSKKVLRLARKLGYLPPADKP